MSEQQKSASFRFMLVILAIGLLAATTTIYVGYTLCDEKPGFMAWMTIGFCASSSFSSRYLLLTDFSERSVHAVRAEQSFS